MGNGCGCGNSRKCCHTVCAQSINHHIIVPVPACGGCGCGHHAYDFGGYGGYGCGGGCGGCW